ncbi:hypothetical protein QBC34DRAFT_364458 [Podospora aff. communis PSN243]|uniref:Uncharacterized protein n=1 Tax=Podospora aff. communis PSN243 TaxID=3040156 RepID=A0AAV9G0M2_9PEZI|nr:hypothetical protein QBC34DRAFT_364458 [Podospora aff. communis PSN243]
MTATMSEARVLEEIFRTLQGLETRIDGQSRRLGTIEFSIKSKSSNISTIAMGTVDESPSEAGPGPESRCSCPQQAHEPASPITPPSSYHVDDLAATYRASITEMRKRFEFIDESSSDIAAAAKPAFSPPLNLRATTPSVDENDKWEDMAVYTESAYSQFPSRLDLATLSDVPPLPNDIRLQSYLHGGKSPFMGGQNARTSQSLDGQPEDRSRSAQPPPSPHRLEERPDEQQQPKTETPHPTALQKPSWKTLTARRHHWGGIADWHGLKASLASSFMVARERREKQKVKGEVTTAATAPLPELSGHLGAAFEKMKGIFSRGVTKTGSWFVRERITIIIIV